MVGTCEPFKWRVSKALGYGEKTPGNDVGFFYKIRKLCVPLQFPRIGGHTASLNLGFPRLTPERWSKSSTCTGLERICVSAPDTSDTAEYSFIEPFHFRPEDERRAARGQRQRS